MIVLTCLPVDASLLFASLQFSGACAIQKLMMKWQVVKKKELPSWVKDEYYGGFKVKHSHIKQRSSMWPHSSTSTPHPFAVLKVPASEVLDVSGSFKDLIAWFSKILSRGKLCALGTRD